MHFTFEQTSRLTQLSPSRLRYWDRTEFFTPVYRDDDRHTFNRLYSFRDVVGLRAIAQLLQEHVSLQELRKVGAYLKKHHDTPWASLKLGVRGQRRKVVCFFDPRTRRWISTRPEDQIEMTIFPMREVASDVQRRVSKLQERSHEQRGKVARHRLIAHNATVIAGTRIPTSTIWKFSEAGYTPKQIQDQYPTLTLEDIRAALAHERSQRRQAS